MAEPKLGDILPTLILRDFLGRKVGVVVDNRLILCILMKKGFSG
jgi:hypothetical protein